MTDKKSPDVFSGNDLRQLIAANPPKSIIMNASVAGEWYDLCKGVGELPDEDGKMHPCVGCLGCGGPKSGQRPKSVVE